MDSTFVTPSPTSSSSSELISPTAVSVIRKINQKNLTIDINNSALLQLASTIPTMLTPPFSSGSSGGEADACSSDEDIDVDVVQIDLPLPKRMRPNELPVNPVYQNTLFNALFLSRQIPFDFSNSIQEMNAQEDDDTLSENGLMDGLSNNGERRRGRPRKPDVVEGEDGKIIAKRMYARQYRENMKTRYDDLKKEIDMHILEKKELKMKLGQLQRLLEECKCIKKPWILWQNLHTQECTHPLDNNSSSSPVDLSISEI